MQKTCKTCGDSKPCADYYAVKGNNDGLSGSCKTCAKSRIKRHREANPELIRERKRAWKRTPAGLAAAKRYRDTAPMKASARSAVSHALRDGRLTKGPCAHAGQDACKGDIEGHHRSYLEEHWLDVLWLCQGHHYAEHLAEG